MPTLFDLFWSLPERLFGPLPAPWLRPVLWLWRGGVLAAALAIWALRTHYQLSLWR